MGKYLGYDGLVRLLSQLKDLFVKNTDVISNSKIDEICDSVIYTSEEVEL